MNNHETSALIERMKSLRFRVEQVCESDTRPLLLHWTDVITLVEATSEITLLQQRLHNAESRLVEALFLSTLTQLPGDLAITTLVSDNSLEIKYEDTTCDQQA